MSNLELLRNKLKLATKTKLKNEVKLLKLRKTNRTLNDDLKGIDNEIEYFNGVIQDLKKQLTEIKNQISMIEICKKSEAAKVDCHRENLKRHKQGFDELFCRESTASSLRHQEILERQAAEAERVRVIVEEAARKEEELAKETAAVDAEADALEKECAVLRKRNHAIMLKLRKKLVETENTRRELMNAGESVRE